MTPNHKELREKLERAEGRVGELERENAHLSDELDEARNEPWPRWADAILKAVREYSGYDGSDDASDGVDVPEEVSEALYELEQYGKRQEEKRQAAEAEAAQLRARVETLETALRAIKYGLGADWRVRGVDLTTFINSALAPASQAQESS